MNFAGFVESQWPQFRKRGFPVAGKPRPRALFCIADADVAAAQLGLTAQSEPHDDWIVEAEAEFTDFLRAKADKPETVHGALLRWNQESLLIAVHDELEAMQRVAGPMPINQSALKDFLGQCTPCPSEVPDARFTNTFDKPQACLAELVRALGWRKLKKGDPRKGEVLRWSSANVLGKLVRRVPDLARIAARFHSIAQSIE